MSPLEIKVYGSINLKIKARGLEGKPPVKIDKTGKESPIQPGRFAPILKGEKAIIPDVPGFMTIETHDSSFTIFKESHLYGDSPPEGDAIRIQVEAKGYGLSSGGERPSISKDHPVQTRDLEGSPVEVWSRNRRLAEVSWRPKKNEPVED